MCKERREMSMRGTVNNILMLLLIARLPTIIVGATSLSEQIASSTDDQTISLDGHQVLNNPSIDRNLTLSGKGNESVLDLSKMTFFLKACSPSDHKRLWLRNLVIQDCIRIYAYAEVVAENCRFENASLDVLDGSLYAKDCVFTGGRLKTCSDHGGALTLHSSSALLDHCSFVNNSAFLNASTNDEPNCIGGRCDGGSGGAISMSNSSMILLRPVMDGNVACSGGAICLINSDLVVRGGRMTNNHALPINYTNPVGFFGGEGGAISAVKLSKVMLIDTIVSGNRAREFPDIHAEDSSEVQIINAKINSQEI